MKISVIFPTYQRPKDLEIALDSLLIQTLLPYETIVVDQSDDILTKELCHKEIYKKIWIKYIYSDCKSPPKAKQIGMDAMSDQTDIFVFFDDDVKLMPNYLEEISNFMKNHNEALWWWWYIINLPHKKSFIEDMGYKLFRTPYISHEFCTPDAQYKHPNKIQNVQSIIGCNMFFRKKIKDMWYKFVDWMKRYGHADDTFFTYQISYDHPKSLFYIPTAKLYHYESKAGRILKSQKFNQILYHRFVFWKKYHFSMITFCRRSIWFLIRNILKSWNKRQIIKDFFRTQKNIWKYSQKIQKNPEYVNTFIYGW